MFLSHGGECFVEELFAAEEMEVADDGESAAGSRYDVVGVPVAVVMVEIVDQHEECREG